MMPDGCWRAAIGVCLACFWPLAAGAGADGASIAVDSAGTVYLMDAGQGPWQIDPRGQVSASGTPPGAYLALDQDGKFAGKRLPVEGTSLKPSAGKPTLIVSDDVPVAVGPDAALYFPQAGQDGRLQIVRLLPSGARSVLATLPATTEDGPLQSINGIAASAQGEVYYTENRAVRKIEKQGSIATLASSVAVPDCSRAPGADERSGPKLRGVGIGTDGTVFVASAGCGATVRISPQGDIQPVLRSPPPWSPAAVAVRDGDVYVLETPNESAGPRGTPRVRKVAADGRVTLVAEIKEHR